MSLPSLMTDRVESPIPAAGPESPARQGSPEGSAAITLRSNGEHPGGPRPHFPMASSIPPSLPLIDREAALSRMGDDLELLQEMAAMFIRDVPRLMASLEAALAAGDAEETARAAHSIKGLASNFGAAPCMEAAFAIEHPARAGQLVDLISRVPPLAEQVERLCGALQKDVL